jgi:hypothetical protein
MEMPMNTRAVWILSGFLLAGCGEGAPTGTLPVRNEVGGERLQTRAVFPQTVYYSGIGQASRGVVRSEGEWQALWAQVVRGRQPTPATPAVDFSREMVIVAAMGTRNTGGYAITVDSVTATPGALHVFVTERSPGGSCGTTQALTAPVDAVALSSDVRAVQFHESTVAHNCG